MQDIHADELDELVQESVARAAAELGLDCSAETKEHERAGPFATVSVSGGTAEVSNLWRWFDRDSDARLIRPVILTAEAWMCADEFAESDYDTVVAMADEVDPRRLLLKKALMFCGVDDLEEIEFSESSDVEPATIESQDIAASVAGEDPALYVFPVDAAWKIAALLELADSGQHESHEHLAILRHFELTYGAQLAATNTAVTILALTAPISDPDLAKTAAIERIGYADTTTGAREYERDEIVTATMADTIWGFWFD